MPEDPNESIPLPSSEDSANAPEATPVERLIAQPLEMAEMNEMAKPDFVSFASPAPRKKPGAFLIFAGILLPGLAVAVELALRICAEEFFDPLPTVWHALIVGFVPLANLYIHLQLRKDYFERRPALGVLNGFVITWRCRHRGWMDRSTRTPRSVIWNGRWSSKTPRRFSRRRFRGSPSRRAELFRD